MTRGGGGGGKVNCHDTSLKTGQAYDNGEETGDGVSLRE